MSHVEGKLSHAHRQRDDGMYSTEIFDAKGETVFIAAWYPVKTETGYTTNREENARCLVARWNALEGVPTEWLENYVAGGAKNLMQENAALKAEVERLRKDAERLDMLELPGIEMTFQLDEDEPFFVSRVTGGRNDREWKILGMGETVREAIDAAMKETK